MINVQKNNILNYFLLPFPKTSTQPDASQSIHQFILVLREIILHINN